MYRVELIDGNAHVDGTVPTRVCMLFLDGECTPCIINIIITRVEGMEIRCAAIRFLAPRRPIGGGSHGIHAKKVEWNNLGAILYSVEKWISLSTS